MLIPYYNDMDYAWLIDDYRNLDGGWKATCEEGELFVNIPKE